MKILNEEEIGPWSTEVTCKCGAILEAEAADFKKRGSVEDGFTVGVVCPRCHVLLVVSQVPPIVWDTVE